MDHAALTTKVEDRFTELVNNRDMFTTVDISHPIIDEDPTVRHRDVRALIQNIINRGDLDEAMYTSTGVTVYPKPGHPVTARVFHPDDPAIDPNTYTAVSQELHRPATAASAPSTPRGLMLDADDDDGTDDGVTILTATPTGATVTKQCLVQSKKDTISVPMVVVRAAGLVTGDAFNVSVSGNQVTITKDANGKQKVDHEGRIRLHGSNIAGRVHGAACTALVVEPAGSDKYIQIQ